MSVLFSRHCQVFGLLITAWYITPDYRQSVRWDDCTSPFPGNNPTCLWWRPSTCVEYSPEISLHPPHTPPTFTTPINSNSSRICCHFKLVISAISRPDVPCKVGLVLQCDRHTTLSRPPQFTCPMAALCVITRGTAVAYLAVHPPGSVYSECQSPVRSGSGQSVTANPTHHTHTTFIYSRIWALQCCLTSGYFVLQPWRTSLKYPTILAWMDSVTVSQVYNTFNASFSSGF